MAHTGRQIGEYKNTGEGHVGQETNRGRKWSHDEEAQQSAEITVRARRHCASTQTAVVNNRVIGTISRQMSVKVGIREGVSRRLRRGDTVRAIAGRCHRTPAGEIADISSANAVSVDDLAMRIGAIHTNHVYAISRQVPRYYSRHVMPRSAPFRRTAQRLSSAGDKSRAYRRRRLRHCRVPRNASHHESRRKEERRG